MTLNIKWNCKGILLISVCGLSLVTEPFVLSCRSLVLASELQKLNKEEDCAMNLCQSTSVFSTTPLLKIFIAG